MCSGIICLFPISTWIFISCTSFLVSGALTRQRGALQHASREKVSQVMGVKLGKASLRDWSSVSQRRSEPSHSNPFTGGASAFSFFSSSSFTCILLSLHTSFLKRKTSEFRERMWVANGCEWYVLRICHSLTAVPCAHVT